MRGGDHLRATGGARAVVFLHGIGAGAEMFAPQIAALGRSCDAIGWNLPGYGGHDLDGEMTFEGLSAALLAFLDRATTMDGTIVRVHARKKVVKEQAVSSPWRDLEDCVRSTEATIGVRRQVCVVVVERQRPEVRGDGGWGAGARTSMMPISELSPLR